MLSKFARARVFGLRGTATAATILSRLAQRVEVSESEVRIMGSRSRLLQALVANGGVASVPTQGLKWRTEPATECSISVQK